MDQELQFLINTIYGNNLNEKQLANIIKMALSNPQYLENMRNTARSKMPAALYKGVSPLLVQRVMNEANIQTPKLGTSSFTFDKNAGKAANDMSAITNFNDAFAAARKAGHKKFFWKKTKANPSGMFSTELATKKKPDSKPATQPLEPLEEVDETLDVEITKIPIDKSKININSWEKDLYEAVPNAVTEPSTGAKVMGNINNLVASSLAYLDYLARPQLNFNIWAGFDAKPTFKEYTSGMYKKGGTMNKVNYFKQGGQPQNSQADVFMKAVLNGDPKAIGQLVQAANQGDKNATQLIQTILQEEQKGNAQVAKAASVIKQLAQGAVSAKWGSKLQYMRSLKYAKGGKHTCPACMAKGGSADENVKVAKKDVDTKTYQKQSFAKKIELDEHRLGTETSSNKNGSYNISHKPSAQDSTEIKRNTMSEDMNKKYPKVKSKACGGSAPKAKKRYFGGII